MADIHKKWYRTLSCNPENVPEIYQKYLSNEFIHSFIHSFIPVKCPVSSMDISPWSNLAVLSGNWLQTYRPALRTFQFRLALQGYLVALLPQALRFVLASCALCLRAFSTSRSQKFSKKGVSQSTQNALKSIEKQNKILYPFYPLHAA